MFFFNHVRCFGSKLFELLISFVRFGTSVFPLCFDWSYVSDVAITQRLDDSIRHCNQNLLPLWYQENLQKE